MLRHNRRNFIHHVCLIGRHPFTDLTTLSSFYIPREQVTQVHLFFLECFKTKLKFENSDKQPRVVKWIKRTIEIAPPYSFQSDLLTYQSHFFSMPTQKRSSSVKWGTNHDEKEEKGEKNLKATGLDVRSNLFGIPGSWDNQIFMTYHARSLFFH